jgi:beta-galactosidase
LATVGGSAVTFTATPATGNTVTTYAWTQNGVAVGTNSPTYVYSGAPSHGGSALTIVCTVTAAAGVASSNTAALTVQVWVG